MKYILLLCIVLAGCSSSSGPSAVHQRDNTGDVVTLMPSNPTADRDELPEGVKAGDVAAVITIGAEQGRTDSDTTAASPLKKKHAAGGSGRITITKDGNVYADDLALSAIKMVETPEPSHAWKWWTGGILSSALAIAWAMKQFSLFSGLLVPGLSIAKRIFGLFKRKS